MQQLLGDNENDVIEANKLQQAGKAAPAKPGQQRGQAKDGKKEEPNRRDSPAKEGLPFVRCVRKEGAKAALAGPGWFI